MIPAQTGPWRGNGTIAELWRARSAGTGAKSAREALEEQQRLQAALLKVVLRVHGQQEKSTSDWLLSGPATHAPPPARLGYDRQDQAICMSLPVRKAACASSLPASVVAPTPSGQSEPTCYFAAGAVVPASLRQALEPSSAGTTACASSRRPQERSPSFAYGAAARHSREHLPGSLRSASVDSGIARRPPGSTELSGQFLAAMRGQTAPLTPRRAPPEGSSRWRSGSQPTTRKEQAAHLRKEVQEPSPGPVVWRVNDILLSDAAPKQ